MKMDIDEENLIIKDALSSNIQGNIKKIKKIDEFGSYKYYISFKDQSVIFCFNCLDFETVYNFSGKDYIDENFKGIFLN